MKITPFDPKKMYELLCDRCHTNAENDSDEPLCPACKARWDRYLRQLPEVEVESIGDIADLVKKAGGSQ